MLCYCFWNINKHAFKQKEEAVVEEVDRYPTMTVISSSNLGVSFSSSIDGTSFNAELGVSFTRFENAAISAFLTKELIDEAGTIENLASP